MKSIIFSGILAATSSDMKDLRDLIVLDDREFGNTGKIPLYWNRNNGLFTET